MKNETNEQINSTNTPIPENFKPTKLTENINYDTINSVDIENGIAELVLKQPFAGDNGEYFVTCKQIYETEKNSRSAKSKPLKAAS